MLSRKLYKALVFHCEMGILDASIADSKGIPLSRSNETNL